MISHRNPAVSLACLLCVCVPGAEAAAQDAGFDIAPFAMVIESDPERTAGATAGRLEKFKDDELFMEWEIPRQPDGTYTVALTNHGRAAIGLMWAERRVLNALGLEYADAQAMPPKEEVEVQYWSSQGRIDDWSSIGQTRWQGEWQPLTGTLEQTSSGFRFAIAPDVPEFANQNGILKVRWILPAEKARGIRQLSAVSPSKTATAGLRLELETPRPGEQAQIEVYNGSLVNADSGDALATTWDLGRPLDLRVQHVTEPPLPDRTVIRVQLPDGGFGVAVADVLENGILYVRDFGLYASADSVTAEQKEAYRQRLAEGKTTLEKVRELPDQTYVRAASILKNPVSNHDPLMLSLATDNSKFIVYRDGSVRALNKEYGQQDPVCAPTFGTGEAATYSRSIHEDWIPIVTMRWTKGSVIYSEEAFVAPMGGGATAGIEPWLNAAPLCTVLYTAENTTNAEVQAEVRLRFTNATVTSPQGGALVAEAGGRPFMLIPGGQAGGEAVAEGDAVAWTATLAPKAKASFVAYLPGLWAAEQAFDPAGLDPAELREQTIAYWQQALAGGMQVTVPEQQLTDLIRSSQVHCYLAARSQEEGRWIEPWIGADRYGPLDTESQLVINGMDLTGNSLFARRSLDYFLSRYNDEGMLANGYTLVGTGQNLWTLAQHYFLTRDTDWVRQMAPDIERTLEWISTERAKTRRNDPDGEPVPESGLMPPGVLADWDRYAYYFYGNAWYQAGMAAAAEMLRDAGIASGERYARGAAEYKEDILRAYRWTQARMPVHQLADGSWVPSYPSSVATFGPTSAFYKGMSSVGHDVEVGGNHLLNLGILDPTSRDASWIADYMEDHWFFIAGEYSLAKYPKEQMARDWFTYGGFSKQHPFYTRNGDIYALQDDIQPFIRTYFNAFPPMLSEETMALWEHFNAVGGWNKTHETGGFLRMTRLMLLMERGEDLWLAPFVTRNWLEDGMEVSVQNAPSFFGPVSYRIASQVDAGTITAEIQPPQRRAPAHIVLRLRHPERKPIRQVTVNGSDHGEFDAASGTITLPHSSDTLTVQAVY